MKIPRVENDADALIHQWGANDLLLWEAMGICFIQRRPVYPESHCGLTTRVIPTMWMRLGIGSPCCTDKSFCKLSLRATHNKHTYEIG